MSLPRFLLGMKIRFATAGELIRTMWNGPFWWLLPFCFVLLLLSGLFVIGHLFPSAAPFVYLLF